jgi:hypothetical protein
MLGEHRLRVYKNRVLRRIFGPKSDEVTGRWKKLHNEELHNSYFSQNIIRVIISKRMRQAGHVACVGEMRNTYKILVGNPEGKRPLRRPRHRWDDNFKMDLEETGLEGMDCVHVAQDRDLRWPLMNMVMNLWFP